MHEAGLCHPVQTLTKIRDYVGKKRDGSFDRHIDYTFVVKEKNTL